MEKWETVHITKHLATLIKVTRCSAVLKAGLKAKELLSDEEDQRLTALGQNEGSIREAKLMYEIMMTRTKGYSGLMQVLHEERQDGALKILKGLQKPESQVASTDSIIQLMNMRVQLANSAKSFNDVLPNFTIEDAKDLLQNGDLKQELEEILRKGSLEIKLDGELPLSSDLYIPRQLSNRLKLDARVFKLDSCKDVFVFKNINRMALTQLVKPHATLSSTGQRSLVTDRHIFLDDEEDWEDMVAVSESPIHLISKEEEYYILERTTKVTEVLLNYVLREGRSVEAFVTEDVFREELLSENHSNGALICDVAMMGKSWLMRNLASKIGNKNETFVAFFIDLPSFSKFISRLDKASPDNQALTTVLKYACSSQLASHLMLKYAAHNGLKNVFVFDGYDELSKDDMEVVKSNLEFISKFHHIRMIISSRPSMRSLLQKTFNLIAYDIQPFPTEDQMRCITEQWRNVIPVADSELCKIEEFARQCIQSVKSIQNGDIHDILGVPLKCRILATVNEKRARQLCTPNRRRSLQIVKAVTIKSVYDLYTVFVDTLVQKMAETMQQDERNEFVNGVYTFHTHMALDLLFPDLSNVYLRNHKFGSCTEKHVGLTGVACFSKGKQRFEFIHRTFAEFFAGRFFAEFWIDKEHYSPGFVQMVGSYFIRNVLVAVDGEWKIHSDKFGNRDVLNLIRSSKWPDCMDAKKLFQLKYPLILFFMNLKAKHLQFERSNHKFRNVASTFETEITFRTKLMYIFGRNTQYGELCGLKKRLAESSFVTIVACIDERLINIFSLYIHILTSFFDPKSRVALLLPPCVKVKNIGSQQSAAWLLCRAAVSKSPKNAVELFSLFDVFEVNFLSGLCQSYPHEYWSPVEVAILTEDIDMIHYFLGKVSLSFIRLFYVCVAAKKKLTEPELDTKLKIMKMVLGSSNRVLKFLCRDTLPSFLVRGTEFTKYSFQLLLKFLDDSRRSISSIKGENKRFILKKCLKNCNDEELVNLLLSLYGKSDDKKLCILNLTAEPTFTAEVLLDALDLAEVTDAFSEVELNNEAFQNCSNLETLKLLTAIQPDFSCCNEDKWNYLHVAASELNIDWVKYLISSGYEVDQLTASGSTPLLCASWNVTKNPKSLLAVTRLLVENGANVYTKSNYGRNVAHCVFDNCRNADSKDLCEWVAYLLENGYHQLWEMRDKYGKTPQELLVSETGKDSAMTIDFLRLLEKYSVVSTK